MERHAAGDAWVLPILLEPVLWEGAPFASLTPLPTDSRPVTSWSQPNEAFRDIALGFQAVLTALESKEKSASPKAKATVLSTASIFMVPFRRDPFFTGREEVLNQLRSMLLAGDAVSLAQPPALSGLGGIGKTQTAIEYAYRQRQDYDVVLWVHSASREEIISDFAIIAGLLQISGSQASDKEILVIAVKRWLEQNTGWLLIFDNADNLEMVAEYIPLDYSGHIIFTTRSQNAGGLARAIDLEKMTLAEGALLLLKRAKLLESNSSLNLVSGKDVVTAQQIVRELDGLPLALNQAGAYIEETKCSVAKYLELYRSHRTELLKRRGGKANLFGHPDWVATTWKLSFDSIEKANPASAELLRLCAFLAPDAIPEELFVEGAEHLGPILEPLGTDDFAFEAALSELLKYSLIRRDPEAQTLTMHRLVQAVLKDEMDEQAQKLWVERMIKTVNATFSGPFFEDWEQCERLLPQVQACLELVGRTGLLLAAAARIFNQAGLYLRDRYGLYQEAESFYREASRI